MRRILLAAALLALLPAGAAAQSHLLVVAGLGGDPEHADRFHGWAVAMAAAAEGRHGLSGDRVTVLTERPERDPRVVDGRSTREAVVASLKAIAARSRPGESVIVLLIGHGSGEGGESKLNLPGPDLTGRDLAAALAPLAGRKVAVINAASASGGFIEALSAKDRVVVTATQSPLEGNETMFGGFFVAAFAGDGADVDKDARVSVLEAYDYARREVERRFREENRLLTEHARLADGGALARTIALTAGPARSSAASAGSETDPLRAEQRRLEDELAALRARKESMPAPAYERELERILTEIARVGRALRERGEG